MGVSGPDFDDDYHPGDFEVFINAVKVVNLQAQGLTIGTPVSIALQAQGLVVGLPVFGPASVKLKYNFQAFGLTIGLPRPVNG